MAVEGGRNAFVASVTNALPVGDGRNGCLGIADAGLSKTKINALWEEGLADDVIRSWQTLTLAWLGSGDTNASSNRALLTGAKDQWSIRCLAIANKRAIETGILDMRQWQVLALYSSVICDLSFSHKREARGLKTEYQTNLLVYTDRLYGRLVCRDSSGLWTHGRVSSCRLRDCATVKWFLLRSRFESVSLCGGKLRCVGAADYGFCGGAFVAVLRADDDPEGDCAAGLGEAQRRLERRGRPGGARL